MFSYILLDAQSEGVIIITLALEGCVPLLQECCVYSAGVC